MRVLVLLCIHILLTTILYANSKKDSILIRGVGSYYKNSNIELLLIEDYISHKEVIFQTSTVDSIGYFEFRFKNIPTQKLVIRSKKNSSFIYVQPGGNYLITIPEKNEYDEKNTKGNYVDIVFYQLDSTDINYKILKFDRWLEKELGEFYHLKKQRSKEYEIRYNELNVKAENLIKNDTNLFFLYHVKFSLIEMDDLESVSANIRIQNYKKWLDKLPVYYRSDTYMNYFRIFYEDFLIYLNHAVRDNLYTAVINRSPSMAMKALEEDETVRNIQVRELVLIQLLYEQCYEKRYPKTNLLFMLDSIRIRSKFSEHREIASNVIERVSELSIGSKFPDFLLFSQDSDTLSNRLFEGKYLYIHFFNPNDENCIKEIQPLKKLYGIYSSYIQFMTIQVEDLSFAERNLKFPWPTVALSEKDNFIKTLKIEIYPSYILLDAYGNIVANPALKPVPNSNYETIEPLFFQIKRAITGERKK